MDKQWLPLDLIKTTDSFLESKGVPSPRLDAEVLLCEVLGCSRVGLYTMFERPLSEDELGKYREMVRRRAAREPVSRILGKKEFMGLSFKVSPAVLSPRPETEILVERTLAILNPSPKKKKSEAVFKAWDNKMREFLVEQTATMKEGVIPEELAQMLEATEVVEASAREASEDKEPRRVLDIGSGSGCISIALACMERNLQVVAVDISSEALAVARDNASALGAGEKVEFREGDLFSSCQPGEKFDIIVSNPPYIPDNDTEIWPEVKNYDPQEALFAGADGLDCYRRLIPEAKNYLKPEGWLLLEVGAGQADDVKKIIEENSPLAEVEFVPDHSGIDRVVVARGI